MRHRGSNETPPRPCVLVVCGRYPVLSETFVVREVQGLRAAGIDAPVVGLRAPEPDATAASEERPHAVVYDGAGAVVRRFVAGLVRHPIRTLRVLGDAAGLALAPGEPTSPRDRAKILVQAIGAVGTAAALLDGPDRAPSHVHCHFAHAPTSVGLLIARFLGVDFSFVGHANDIFAQPVLLRRKLERARFVSCISAWHRDFYRERHDRPDDAYRIIRCGVPMDEWSRPAPPAAEAPDAATPARDAAPGATPARDAPGLVTVGRLVPKKGIDLLIAAVERLPAPVRARVTVDVVGDGPERTALEQQAASVADATIRFHGAQPGDAVRAAIAASELFVLPCRTDASGDRDGIPVVLMEAMALEVPVVVGDLPAIRELVRDGETGVIVPADDPDTLARTLERLLDDAAERRRLGSAGHDWAHAEFSQSVNVQRLVDAIGLVGDGVHASQEGADP